MGYKHLDCCGWVREAIDSLYTTRIFSNNNVFFPYQTTINSFLITQVLRNITRLFLYNPCIHQKQDIQSISPMYSATTISYFTNVFSNNNILFHQCIQQQQYPISPMYSATTLSYITHVFSNNNILFHQCIQQQHYPISPIYSATTGYSINITNVFSNNNILFHQCIQQQQYPISPMYSATTISFVIWLERILSSDWPNCLHKSLCLPENWSKLAQKVI